MSLSPAGRPADPGGFGGGGSRPGGRAPCKSLMISGRLGGRGVAGRRPGRPAKKSKIFKIITVAATTAGRPVGRV